METLAVIPARYNSSRLPGKPLARIGDKPMVMHVHDRVKNAGVVTSVIVATDHQDIAEAVKKGGGECIMTGSDHQTGTERCTEAFRKYRGSAEIILNVQGDEPFIECGPLKALIDAFRDPVVDIATLASPMDSNEALLSPHSVKVVTDRTNKAMYFSRNPIPFMRNYSKECWADNFPYLRHLGIYAFRNTALEQIATLKPSALEAAESLEQLRWMEYGFPVHIVPTDGKAFSVDTAEDLENARNYYKKHIEQSG